MPTSLTSNNPAFVPPLDEGFRPAVLANRALRQAATAAGAAAPAKKGGAKKTTTASTRKKAAASGD